jgi:polysaccharide biosynthesis/export protein
MKLFSIFLFSFFSLTFFSCRTQKKVIENYNYLQAVNDSNMNKQLNMAEAVIQKNDLLSIRVYSASTKPDVSDALYNLPATTDPATNGFLVDGDGNIEYPRVGVIHAEGLTKLQLAAIIKAKLTGPLQDPSVIIRFLNYKVTVMGEVGNGGVFNIPNERVTILEAIGLAGGITIDGKKTTVKVVREANGKRETGIVNLTEKNLFESPYYNLQQNDVVLVETSIRRIKQTEQQNTIQKVGFIFGLITGVALIYNSFK